MQSPGRGLQMNVLDRTVHFAAGARKCFHDLAMRYDYYVAAVESVE
jgi:hypothetical protein